MKNILFIKKIYLVILFGSLIINIKTHAQTLSPLDSLDIYNPFTQSDQLRRIIKTRLSILSGENKTLINKYAIQIENARKSNSKLDEAEALVNTGYIFFKSALYNLALDYYLRALDIYEEMKETTKAAIVEIDIGRTYYFADLVSDSKEYITNAYRKLVKTNNEELIAYANYAMGIIVDNPTRREAHFKKALEIQKRVIKSKPDDYKTKENYSRYLNANGHVEQALKVAEEIDDKWLMVLYLNNIGQIKYTEGRYKEAIEIYQRSLKISKAAKLMGLLKNAYVNLAVIYRLLEDWQKSASYREIAAYIIESLYEEQYSIQLSEIRVKYETRKKELENEFLKKEKEIMQDKIDDEIKLNYFLLLTLLGISFTTALAILSRRKIKSANVLLAKQKDEINVKNEILESLNSELRKSEDNLNIAMSTAHLANWEWDPAKDEITYSKELPKIYGLKDEELKTNPRKVILEKIHPDDRESFINYFYENYDNKKSQESEYRIINNDKVNWIRAKRIPIFNDNGQLIKILGTVQEITENKKIEETKIQLAVQQSFTEQLIKSQEEERKRIASEIHDSLGQDILLIKNRAQLGLKVENLDPFAIEQLEKINDASGNLLNLVREISFDLRPAHLERLGLTEVIISLIKKVSETTKINFKHNIDNIDKLLSSDNEINFYRIIQEGLSNIVKHSEASKAEIDIRKKENHILVEIIDNGKGFELNTNNIKSNGFGLINITNRIKIMNGELTLDSQSMTGAKLSITIPFNK